ncbi:MAG TPA: hypothetical protein VGB61_06550, partial [Pyrinomonadaceae bacterium]
MEPEIARRCLSCGASVRGRASFCPQCGSRMAADESRPDGATAGTEPPTPARSPLVEEAARVAATLNEKLPPRPAETSASGSHRVPAEREREPRAREDAAHGAQATQSFGRAESVAEPGAGMPPPQQQAAPRGGIGRRAATVGASVGENLRPRVEKLR